MMTSRNAGIRKFATEMVRDHTDSTRDVKAAAAADRIHVGAPALTAMQARNLAALRRARGAARDRLYVEQQKVAHRNALALMQGYADNGRAPTLKATAGKIVPVIKMHIGMLDNM